MTNKETQSLSASPKWGTSTKIIVTLLILAGVIALLFRFSGLVTMLVTALILAILLHPLADWIHQRLKISWNWSVTITYFFTVLLLFGLMTLGGIAVIDQVQGLVRFLQDSIDDILGFLTQLSTTVWKIGPFELDFTYIDWNSISNQLLSTIQPLLARLGSVIGALASGTAGLLGSFFLSLIISFLLLNESGGARKKILSIEIPGYQQDFAHMGEKFNIIWNAFLRGQAIVLLMRFIIYVIILSIFRVRFLFGMALLATLGNFIPYIGVAISWITIFFVSLLQGSTVFGLGPLPYALIVMGVGWITDNMYDTFFTPRVMADVLEIHPAAVMVAVLVGLNLFGLLGMFLAAPILATLKLLLSYVGKKLTDQNPWEETENKVAQEKKSLLGRVFNAISDWTKGKIGTHIHKPDIIKKEDKNDRTT